MKKQKKLIIIVLIIALLISIGTFLVLFFNKEESDELKEINKVLKGNFAMYVDNGDGNYQEVSAWPGETYKLNDTKTVCVNNNGDQLENSITYKDGKIEFTTSSAVYCYLYFDKIPPTLLDNVRYVKDCINNNSVNFNKEWIEIQAFYKGQNVALNKTVTGSGYGNSAYVVDGVTSISETRLSATSIDTYQSSYNSEVGGYRYIKRVNFKVADLSLNDKLFFQIDTVSADIEDVEFNDYNANSFDNLFGDWSDWESDSSDSSTKFSYSIQHDKTGLHVVDINDPIKFYVSGYLTVTQDMITDGTSNYSQLRFIDIRGAGLSSASLNFAIKNPNYYFDFEKGSSCVTVDLGKTYNLDEVKVWHYYKDGRSYKNHNLSVSADNSSWSKLINNESGVIETSAGKSYSVIREQ